MNLGVRKEWRIPSHGKAHGNGRLQHFIAKYFGLPQALGMSSSALEDLIKSHAPRNATVYVFTDWKGVYPREGAFALEPFTAPTGIPAGDYSLVFRETAWSPINLPPLIPTEPPPVVRLGGRMDPAGVVHLVGKDEALAKQSKSDPLLHHPDHVSNRVAFERTKMFDENITSEQLIGKSLAANREIGEAFVLSKAWRQEAENTAVARKFLQDENLRLAKIIQEERLMRAVPAESAGAPVLSFLGQLVALIAPALTPSLAKRIGGAEPVLDATIGSDEESEVEKETKKAKSDLKDAKDRIEEQKRKRSESAGDSKRIAELEATLKVALAELDAMRARRAQRNGKKSTPEPAQPKGKTDGPAGDATVQSAGKKVAKEPKRLTAPKETSK